MSVAQYAKHRGVTSRAVAFALEKGRISRDASGWIESDQADKDWEKNTNPRISAAGKINGAIGQEMRRARQPKVESPTTPPATLFRTDPDIEQFQKARAVRERFAAAIAKLEYEERSGKLIDRAEVLSAAYSHYRALRDSLLAIPDRISAQLAAETDAVAVHDVLSNELRKILDKASTMRMTPPRREREVSYGNVG